MAKLVALSMPVNIETGATESVNFTVVTDDGEHAVRSIPSDHPNYGSVEAMVADFRSGDLSAEDLADKILDAADLERVVKVKFEKIDGLLEGRMALSEGKIFVDGDPIDPALEGHIMRLLGENGKPKDDAHWRAFAAFVNNLYTNASEFVRGQLFGWLNYENLHGQGFTLTEDGCFIGYKGCAGTVAAPTSISTGTAIVNGERHHGAIPNPVGAVVEMPRSQVQADPSVGCSTGLHVGTYDYASGWSRGVLLTVKVNPRDVVSVPTECNAQKIRTCRYEVLEVVEGPKNGLTYFGGAYATEGDTSDAYVTALTAAVAAGDDVEFTYHGFPRTVTADNMENVGTGWRFSGTDDAGDYKTYKVSKMEDLTVYGEHGAMEIDAEGEDEDDDFASDLAEVEDLLGEAMDEGALVAFDYKGRPRVVMVEDFFDAPDLRIQADDNGQTKTFIVSAMSNVRLAEDAAPTPAADSVPADSPVALLQDAQREGKAVTFRYNGRLRTVEIEDVWKTFGTQAWTVKGRSQEDNGVRTFTVDKMSDVEVSQD